MSLAPSFWLTCASQGQAEVERRVRCRVVLLADTNFRKDTVKRPVKGSYHVIIDEQNDRSRLRRSRQRSDFRIFRVLSRCRRRCDRGQQRSHHRLSLGEPYQRRRLKTRRCVDWGSDLELCLVRSDGNIIKVQSESCVTVPTAVCRDRRRRLGFRSRNTVRWSESDPTGRSCQIRVGQAVQDVLNDGRPGHADDVVRDRAE